MRVTGAIVAAVLTLPAGGARSQGADPAVDRVVACAVAQAGAAWRSATQAERAQAERRAEVLRGLVPRAALAAGTDEGAARAALARAWQRVETRSLTLDPPGAAGAPGPSGCEAIADAPETYLDGLRRR